MMRNSSSKESVFSRLDAVMLIAARHAEGQYLYWAEGGLRPKMATSNPQFSPLWRASKTHVVI
eukprot:scaffold92456_cov63-Cyclotella_meneghiniana.AAC.4